MSSAVGLGLLMESMILFSSVGNSSPVVYAGSRLATDNYLSCNETRY